MPKKISLSLSVIEFDAIVRQLMNQYHYEMEDALNVAGSIQRNNILENTLSEALEMIPRPQERPPFPDGIKYPFSDEERPDHHGDDCKSERDTFSAMQGGTDGG